MEKKTLLKQFGLNVRHSRQASGLSQEELAERCGLHRTYIGGIERGERNITLINILKIAKSLNIDARELMNGLVIS